MWNTQHRINEIFDRLQHLRDQVFCELDEHREAINADTTEVTHTTQRLDELERKLDILTEYVAQLQQRSSQLRLPEQQLFVVLYTTEQPLTLAQLAVQSGIQDVHVSLHRLELAGVPLAYTFTDQERVMLAATFKEQQAKQEVVHICSEAKARVQAQSHKTLDAF